jgi:Cu2+-exporting ATPase
MSSCCSKCFHCGGNLPQESLTADFQGNAVPVCSADCRNTVADIVASGLSDFYARRDNPDANTELHKPVENWETLERPAVMREFVREADDGDLIADLLIQGVHCAACTWLIESTLGRTAGVRTIEVNPVTTRAELRWNPGQVTLADLLRAIESIGFIPVPFTEQQTQAIAEEDKRQALRRLVVAGLGMMQVTSYAIAMYAGAFQGMDPQIQEFLRLISLLVATPIVLYSGAPFFSGALRNLRTRHIGMDVPVALAIGSAWAASVWNTFIGSGEVYFDSATMFVFFLSGTRYLEAAGRYRAFDLTHALAQHIPCTATRLTATGTEEVGVMELETGDTALVAEGLAFPADGTLLDDTAQVDESMLTGESVSVRRRRGDSVVAGTVNLGSTVQICVEKTGASTVLAQIGRLATQAGKEKPQLIQLTDRIASVFVSIVLVVAALAGIVWWQIDPGRAFEVVLCVLVVSCPCALALATPAALTVATSSMARIGFLVRRAGALPALAASRQIVFDKTGTLTENSLEIESIATTGNLDQQRAMAIAAALEAGSAHPIARAFINQVRCEPAASLRSVPGGGLEGLVDGEWFRIGTYEFAKELSGTGTAELAATDSATRSVYLASNAGVLARFTISERLREGAANTITALKNMGINVAIASGDQAAAVEALATRVGVADWQAEMLPEQKLERVRNLQAAGGTVTAVGDGINDSPVLAGADVSIAMGNGTSIAQHSADCVWLGNQLTGLDGVFVAARRTMAIVRQNLVWALFYNLLAIPLAVGGMLAPWMAALGMSLSSLLVMLNALRLGTAITAYSAKTEDSSCCASTATPEPVL